MRIQIHLAGGCFGGFLAVVEEVDLTVGHADQHEAAAADIPGCRVDHRQGKTRGYSRVHGVATLAHDGDTGFGGLLVHADHHGAAGMGGPQASGPGHGSQYQPQGNYMKNQRFTQGLHMAAQRQELLKVAQGGSSRQINRDCQNCSRNAGPKLDN